MRADPKWLGQRWSMTFRRFFQRRWLTFAGMMLALSISSLHIVEAAELVMFQSKGCIWCEAWDAEIGVIYNKTSEGKIVPLRRVDMDGDRPADLVKLEGLIYTPTFVVMNEGQEVGRIVGYPGEDFFWQFLNIIIKKL